MADFLASKNKFDNDAQIIDILALQIAISTDDLIEVAP